MPQLSLQSCVKPDSSHVIDRAVRGEALLIHLNSGEYYSLNALGTQVWALMDGQRSLGDIAQALVVEYDVTLEQAQMDVLNLAMSLLEEQLVVLV